MVWAVVGLSLTSLACHDASPGAQTGLILDQLSAREAAYHTSVGALTNTVAIQCETATYAKDMHELLDSMRQSCRETQGGGMMGGYTAEDMMDGIDRMRMCVDDYTERVRAMQVKENILDACEEHHAAMNEMLSEMHSMLENRGR
jgi:hypothetical protein